jgi:hypothetical protein
MEQKQDGPSGSGLSHSAAEAIASVCIIAIGAVMIVDNYRIGAGWASDGPQSGYFPLRIGVILCLASLVVLFKSMFGKQRERGIFVSWQRLKPVLLVLLPTTVYVLAIKFLGIYIASALFIAAFMRVMDKSRWWKILLVSIGVNALLFWMFEIQFMVPLPKGPLEALFGY